MKKALWGSLLLAAPLWAQAQTANTVDVYYTAIAELEVEDSEFDDGDGFGVRGKFSVSPQVFLTGEYQTNDYEDLEGVGTDGESDVMRLGAGFRFEPEGPLYIRGEYIDAEFDAQFLDRDDSGWGAFLGAGALVNEGIGLYGEVGYVDVGDIGDGLELRGGIAFALSPQLALFAEYRYIELESDDFESTLGDLNAGVRLAF